MRLNVIERNSLNMNYVIQQVDDKYRLYRKHIYILNVHMLMYYKLSVKNYTRSPLITQKQY
jgi:hypothetical protein